MNTLKSFEPAPLDKEVVLDPRWLGAALSGGGKPVRLESVELLETIGWNCLNLRVKVTYADGGRPDGFPDYFCVKGLFGEQHPEYFSGGALVSDTLFYKDILPRTRMNAPACYYGGVDDRGSGVLVLEDLEQRNAKFHSHLDSFSVEEAHETIDQLARLHGAMSDIGDDDAPWLKEKLELFAQPRGVPTDRLTEAMHGPRGDPLPEKQRDGAIIYEGLRKLAERGKDLPSTVIHGDSHIGNVFKADGKFGFIDFQIVQRAHWSIDLAYHIGSILTVEDRRANEQDLVRYYLDRLGEHGGHPPDFATAWRLFREGAPYGFFLWSVTMRVDAPIVESGVKRLGLLVADHDSYGMLGL